MYTLKRVRGTWFLNGTAYNSFHEALTEAFKAR